MGEGIKKTCNRAAATSYPRTSGIMGGDKTSGVASRRFRGWGGGGADCGVSRNFGGGGGVRTASGTKYFLNVL